jgi:hypothetical protein
VEQVNNKFTERDPIISFFRSDILSELVEIKHVKLLYNDLDDGTEYMSVSRRMSTPAYLGYISFWIANNVCLSWIITPLEQLWYPMSWSLPKHLTILSKEVFIEASQSFTNHVKKKRRKRESVSRFISSCM